jgi:hypothetical protein
MPEDRKKLRLKVLAKMEGTPLVTTSSTDFGSGPTLPQFLFRQKHMSEKTVPNLVCSSLGYQVLEVMFQIRLRIPIRICLTRLEW